MAQSSRQWSSLLAGAFFFSGFASLVYQVAWQRLLTIPFGAGAVSTILIVSVYMLGLGFGALLGGRLASRSVDPWIVYALVEAALGLTGLASLPLISSLGQLTAAVAPAVSFACLFALLSVPTLLMGMTLPVLTKIFAGLTGEFLASVSRLYFVNTLGASLGALLASYLLISLVGLDGCVWVGAAVDFLLAAVILYARRVSPETVERPPSRPSGTLAGLGRVAYLLAFVAGFTAIGYEIVWYRVVGVLVKDSPYAFSSVLSVYLLGVAFGSLVIQKYPARALGASRRDLYFAIQFFIGLAVLSSVVGFYYFSRYPPLQRLTRVSFLSDLHPSFGVVGTPPELSPFERVFLALDVFAWPMALMLVPTILMGASFPLVASLALSRMGKEGQTVGLTSFFVVLGNVLGGLLTGFLLLPRAGTETTLLVFSACGLMFGLGARTFGGRRLHMALRVAGVLLPLVAGIVVFPLSGELFTAMHVPPFERGSVNVEEGIDAVVLTYDDGERFRNYINGQGHGYRPGPIFLAEAAEAFAFAPSPRDVLVIGFGAGSATEVALASAEARRVTVVELCGSLITNLRKYPVFRGILDDGRVRLVLDDGRRFLRRTGELYQVMLMDPLRATTAQSNNLHSREFFALAAGHLAPGGVLMVGGLSDSPVVLRTLMEVFPHVRAYPGFSLASQSPLRRNTRKFEQILRAFPTTTQAQIREFAAFAQEGAALTALTAGVPANRDWHPVSEYYLGQELRRRLACAGAAP